MLTMRHNNLALVIVFLKDKESNDQWWIKLIEVDLELGSINSRCPRKEPALLHFPKTGLEKAAIIKPAARKKWLVFPNACSSYQERMFKIDVLGEKNGDPRSRKTEKHPETLSLILNVNLKLNIA